MNQYSAKYFGKTCQIIKENLPESKVTLQFFQRKDDVVLCGINEVLELLKNNTDTTKYSIKYLPEGTILKAKDIVLELEGPYYEFGNLEGIIDGILARQSSIATNARKVVNAANGKTIVFMGDRQDHYLNQSRDGYAVSLGGISVQVTDEQIKYHNGTAIGTVPHALIQAFDGDIVKALHAYAKSFPNEKLTALVDFNNDVLTDSIRSLKEFGNKLSAIRIDTSENMSDAMFKNQEEFGVTINMVKKVREELDKNGGQHVKIIISSGLSPEKIKEFEFAHAPVDVYGVGGSILKINVGFTADAVRLNGKNLAKKGREYKEQNNLVVYK